MSTEGEAAVYTIKHAAQLLGVSEAALRAWQRRYGVVEPARSAGGYRLYGEQDLADLALMQTLIDEGWAPQQAATHVIEGRRGGAGSRRPGPGPVRHTPQDLVDAAAGLAADHIADLLDSAFAAAGFELVTDQVVLPALALAGRLWAEGKLSVAAEHLLAAAVHRRFTAAYEAAAREPNRATVLVGTPPGSRHELGALGFAVAARRAGLATSYLGTDLPAPDWSAAVARHRPRWVVLTLHRTADAEAVAAVAQRLQGDRSRAKLAVGGQFQDLAPPEVLRLGHQIGAAATLLAGP